ncbi:MAG: dipeptidase [Anaerolineae bacterium]
MNIDTLNYIQQHQKDFQQAFIDLLRIPSVSTLPEHAEDVQRAAAWIIAQMQQMGMTRAELFQKPGFLPLVYGEWLEAGANAPTVLVYCHYDVQPATIEDGWDTHPFDPTEKDGKLYARGAVDSKAHVVAHLKAVEAMLASDEKSPVNIKLLFEGEEESGSEHIFGFVAENPDLLRADVCVISDGSNPEVDQPLLVYGMRGITTMEVHVIGPQRDLHSGHYGGSVHNPLQALAEIIAQLHDADGRVTVPGFYDEVLPLTDDERQVLAEIRPIVENEWEAITNAPQPWGEPEYTINERIGARPTLEINGMAGGFYGTGFKTVLPSRAIAKISCRLVPDQDPQRIAALVSEHIARLTPPTVRSEVVILEEGAPGVLFDYTTPAMHAAVRAYEQGWGVKPILSREGGSVPVTAAFQKALGLPIISMPFGYKGCGAHSTNEYMVLDMFHKGIATAIHFHYAIAELMAEA